MEEPRFHVSRFVIKATIDDWDPENAIELDERDSLASVLARFDMTEDTPVKRSFADHIRLFIIVFGLLTETDFLKLIPPSSPYMMKSTKGGTTRTEARHDPNPVALWNDFVGDVNSVSWDSAPKYSPPIFQTWKILCDESEVQHVFVDNVLRPLHTLLAGNAHFHSHSIKRDIIGQPDFILIDNSGKLWLAVEVKTKWSLPDSDNNLVEAYQQDLKLVEEKEKNPDKIKLSVFYQLRQIFEYLRNNDLQFGVLTTYDKTWFLSRSRDNPDLLYVSPAIRIDNVQPTLLQCFSYIIGLARNAEPLLSSPSPPTAPSAPSNYANNGDGDDYHDKKGKKRKAREQGPVRNRKNPARNARCRGSLGTGSRNTTRPNHPLDGEKDHLGLDFFYRRDFQILGVFGSGRSGTVLKAIWREEIVALKICDLWKHPDYEKELLNEVEVYRALANLQGVCVPRLKGAGYNSGGLFVIATEIVGHPLKDEEHLSDEEREVIRKALSTIHDHGYVHDDIRGSNILIDRSGVYFRAYFIDFTFSKKGDRSDFEEEMMTLIELIG